MLAVSNSGTDYVGCQLTSAQGSSYNSILSLMVGTFTEFHRPFLDNEPLFDSENPQQFKDDYMGRVLIASEKIATDTSDKEGNWEIRYDKEGITIEDAVFTIQLSRKKKDKRVIGVMGMSTRMNSRPERRWQ
jgi:hypothetical protein